MVQSPWIDVGLNLLCREILPCSFRGSFPHVKCSKLYVYAYIWHSNEGGISLFFCSPGKYMHRRIQVLLAMMPGVRFNSFQHNLFYFFFHSLCALCLETGQSCTVRTGLHPCVQNPTAGPLQRQSMRKKMFSSVCWSTFLWMKEQLQIQELLEASKDKAKLL